MISQLGLCCGFYHEIQGIHEIREIHGIHEIHEIKKKLRISLMISQLGLCCHQVWRAVDSRMK